MRDRLIKALPRVRYRRFLVYLMGPYKGFDLDDLMSENVSSEKGPFVDEWTNDPASEYEQADVQELLERTRDVLRSESGLNAFLAIDAEIPLEEMDAASQSIAFARASNVVVLVAPKVGKNLGVGIETGAVLEALDTDEQERVVFVHESGVRSAMIDALARRWDATILTYETEADLVDQIRTFAIHVMNAEYAGDLPTLDDEETVER